MRLVGNAPKQRFSKCGSRPRTSPEDLWEMWILEPHPRPTDLWGWGWATWSRTSSCRWLWCALKLENHCFKSLPLESSFSTLCHLALNALQVWWSPWLSWEAARACPYPTFCYILFSECCEEKKRPGNTSLGNPGTSHLLKKNLVIIIIIPTLV